MLKNRRLLDTFLDIHKNARSGILRFEKGKEKRQLVLHKGVLVFAESNLPDEHLVRILVRLDLMPRAKVNEIASLMKTGKTSEEAVLTLSSFGPQDLEKGRREQAILILASLWVCENFEMRFFPGEDLIRCQVNLNLTLPEALVLAARRAVSGRIIQMPPDYMQGTFQMAEDCAAKALDLPLDSSESYVYSLLHTPVHAAEVLALLPSAEAKPWEILSRLCLLGMVEMQLPSDRAGESGAAIDSSPTVQTLEDMLTNFKAASLYGVLSVPPEANQQEIQAAYHQMAKRYHPDRFQSQEFSAEDRDKAEQVFTLINKAYLTLKDPVSRADYNEKRIITESKVEAGMKARGSKQSEDKKTAEALFHEGRDLLAKGDFETAIERLKGCVWLDPEKAVYYHYLGIAQSEMPKLRKSAEQSFLKAIELNRMTTASRLELAKLYIKVELFRKAEIQLQQLMRWAPDNHEVQKLLADLKKR